jgi:uncharacterized protein DUF2505
VQVQVAHDFPCDAERYWRTFFDDDYNRALDLRMHMTRTVLERTEDERGIRRLIRFELGARDLPALVKKVAGDRIGYEERTAWHRAGNAMDLQIVPSIQALRGKFEMSGVFRVVADRPGIIRREIRAEVAVRIPLLGGQLERLVAEELRKSYDSTAAFTRTWLAEHPT